MLHGLLLVGASVLLVGAGVLLVGAGALPLGPCALLVGAAPNKCTSGGCLVYFRWALGVL